MRVEVVVVVSVISGSGIRQGRQWSRWVTRGSVGAGE